MAEQKQSTGPGIYIGVSFDERTNNMLTVLCEKLNVEIPEDGFHTTLIHSKTNSQLFRYFQGLGSRYVSAESCEKLSLHVWDAPELKKVLVLSYKCDYLSSRYTFLKNNFPDFSFEFDIYNPYITLSYDYKSELDSHTEVSDLVEGFDKIKIILEYSKNVTRYLKIGDWMHNFMSNVLFVRTGPVDTTLPSGYDIEFPVIPSLPGMTVMNLKNIYAYFTFLHNEWIVDINEACIKPSMSICSICKFDLTTTSTFCHRCLDCNRNICDGCKENSSCLSHDIFSYNSEITVLNCDKCHVVSSYQVIGEWIVNRGHDIDICPMCILQVTDKQDDEEYPLGWCKFDPHPLIMKTGMGSLLEWVPLLSSVKDENILLYNMCPSSANYHRVGFTCGQDVVSLYSTKDTLETVVAEIQSIILSGEERDIIQVMLEKRRPWIAPVEFNSDSDSNSNSDSNDVLVSD